MRVRAANNRNAIPNSANDTVFTVIMTKIHIYQQHDTIFVFMAQNIHRNRLLMKFMKKCQKCPIIQTHQCGSTRLGIWSDSEAIQRDNDKSENGQKKSNNNINFPIRMRRDKKILNNENAEAMCVTGNIWRVCHQPITAVNCWWPFIYMSNWWQCNEDEADDDDGTWVKTNKIKT